LADRPFFTGAQNDGAGRKVVLHGGGQFWNFSEKPACIVYGGGGSGSGENHAVKTLRHDFFMLYFKQKSGGKEAVLC